MNTSVDWNELNDRLRPDFLKQVAQLQKSMTYPCVREVYAHTMPQAAAFAQTLLGSDPKRRYESWIPELTAACRSLADLGVTGYSDLIERISTREGVELLLAQTGITLARFAGLVYYLAHWCIPPQVPLRELLDPDVAEAKSYAAALKQAGFAGSLDLLEHGRTVEGRRRMAAQAGVPLEFVTDLVHRADMRRLPFCSNRTTNHLIHGGAPSIAVLASIDPQQYLRQVLAYGQSIGKDLKYGVEPVSVALIARILPSIVLEE